MVSNVPPMSAGQPREPCVILSPHLDDAVLSVWHLLASDDVIRVVTVFAGVPEDSFVTALDRARGATESAELVRRRRADDRAALALAGREPVHADLLDVDYRAFRVPRLREAIERDPARFIPLVASAPEVAIPAEELERTLGSLLDGAVVYAPLGIGAHPDHRDVARLGLRLAEHGRAVRLYADVPYLVRHGAPTWLGATENPAADVQVERAFAALPAAPEAFERRVVELPPEQTETKMAAFARYETELALLDADFGGAVTDRGAMRLEAYWIPRRHADA